MTTPYTSNTAPTCHIPRFWARIRRGTRCEAPAVSGRRRLLAIRKVHPRLRLADPTCDEDINLAVHEFAQGQEIHQPRQAKRLTRDYLYRSG